VTLFDNRCRASAAASGWAVRRRATNVPIAERSDQEPAEAQRRSATQRTATQI